MVMSLGSILGVTVEWDLNAEPSDLSWLDLSDDGVAANAFAVTRMAITVVIALFIFPPEYKYCTC